MFWNKRKRMQEQQARAAAYDQSLSADLADIEQGWKDFRPASARSLVTIDSLGETIVATLVDGQLTADKVSDLAYELRHIIERDKDARNLVLDLQNVDYMDSMCLNMFVELMRQVRELGGGIAVASAVQHVEVLFKLTRLDQLFPIKRDVMEAIAAVERQAA